MFRNTGANAFAKNRMRLAYEDKRDLYCKYTINLSTEYPVGLQLCRMTPGDPTICVKFETTMTIMVRFAQLMIIYRKYHYFCDPSSRFRDTADF